MAGTATLVQMPPMRPFICSGISRYTSISQNHIPGLRTSHYSDSGLQRAQSHTRNLARMSSSSETPAPPPISHILETILYVRDVDASVKFYNETFNVDPAFKVPSLLAVFPIGNTTLLLFKLGATDQDRSSAQGVIPKHGPTQAMASSLLASSPDKADAPSLRQHFCFAVSDPGDVTRWDEHLQRLGVNITGRMEWERGGKGIYFEDPDGHVGEIVSRGIWPHY